MAYNHVPPPEEVFLRIGLYNPITFSDYDGWELLRIRHFLGTFDTYCPECKRVSTYRRSETHLPHATLKYFDPVNDDSNGVTLYDWDQFVSLIDKVVRRGTGTYEGKFNQDEYEHRLRESYFSIVVEESQFSLHFNCTRVPNHTMVQHFLLEVEPEFAESGVLTKIGQYPSLADLSTAEVKQWQKVLPNDKRREYVRAVRLHASGVGAGSLLYLRRVYEHLLVKEYEQARQADTSLPPREGRRVGDLLKDISDCLPHHMGENPVIYGILSKGVHELDEDECMSYFPVLKQAVDLVLLDLYKQREESKIRTQNAKDLNRIGTNLDGNTDDRSL